MGRMKNDLIGILIGILIGTLNKIKLYHWIAQEYSTHKVLDSLHTDLSNKVDLLVESYIGKYGPVEKLLIKTEERVSGNKKDIIKFLKKTYKHIKKLYKLNDREFQNIIDEMLIILNQSLYLLRMS